MQQETSLQTNTTPLQSQKLIEEFVESQKSQKSWSSAVLLANGYHLVILLVDQGTLVVQALRIALETEGEIVAALKLLNPNGKTKIECILAAGATFDITSLESLQEVYEQGEAVLKTYKQAYTYFDHKSGGRGERISKQTAQQVVFDAKGFCMYEGCGECLLQDSLTGVKANFHYLAHIIASSEDGPRGGKKSAILSDDASNIMLLCDKHHRLIDKIAVKEHTIEYLRDMRAAHMVKAATLLKGMAYTPVPTFTAIYPVGGSVPTIPTAQEMAVTLHPLHSYPNGMVVQLLHNFTSVEITDHDWCYSVPRDFRHIRNTLQSTKDYDQIKSGVYAIAPGAILVALGAVIGNKNGLVAVPRYRKGGWSWRNDKQSEQRFTVEKIDSLDEFRNADSCVPEVAVSLLLTDSPSTIQTAIEVLKKSNIPQVKITATRTGQQCIASPQDCESLRQVVHELLHELRNVHSTNRIHLFHCASNAALVEAGRAIEHFHPSVRVYEYSQKNEIKLVLPRLDITPDGNHVAIKGTPLEDVDTFRDSYFSLLNKKELAHV